MPLNDNDGEFSTQVEDELVYRGPVEIGAPLAVDRGSGSYAEDGPMEIGSEYEIGAAAFGDAFEHELSDEQDEIGRLALRRAVRRQARALDDDEEPPVAMGAQEAVVKVVKTARDNRHPAPPMIAVDPDAAVDLEDWGLSDTIFGAAEATAGNPFPLTSTLLARAGAASEPRLVRVDTEESYKAFRTANSPELAALAEHVEALAAKLEDHIHDPDAHEELAEDIAEVDAVGAELAAAEDEKKVDLWMPSRFDGKVHAWREGDFICTSIALPGQSGEVRICTTLEPVDRAVSEMSYHAAQAGVPASSIVGVLPAMGCVLGAGTAMKEMAAAAPSILQRPEMAAHAPFEVQIVPKVNPALAALMMLASLVRDGDRQAVAEWKALAKVSPEPVKQAMHEAVKLLAARK